VSVLTCNIDIEVVYAEPQQQILVSFSLPAPVTVQDALNAAMGDKRFDTIDVGALHCGVFGRAVRREHFHSHRLSAGDRVELYRELVVDARTARLRRASEQQRNRN